METASILMMIANYYFSHIILISELLINSGCKGIKEADQGIGQIISKHED